MLASSVLIAATVTLLGAVPGRQVPLEENESFQRLQELGATFDGGAIALGRSWQGSIDDLPLLHDLPDDLAIRVDGMWFSDDVLEYLAEVPALRSLDISFSQVTSEGLVHLKALTGLESFFARTDRCTDTTMEYIQGLSRLRSLDIMDSQVTDKGFAHLAGLEDLTSLNLINTGVTDASMPLLAERVKLRELMLPSQITDAGLVPLAGLKQLRRLFLERNSNISGSGLAYLPGDGGEEGSGLHPAGNGSLEYLHLNNSGITDDDLAFLQHISTLKEVELEGTTITARGMRHLAALPNLEVLDVPSAKDVTDADLEVFSKLQNLRTLTVRGEFTDQGVAHLAKLENLEVLILRSSQITDVSIEYLWGLKKLRRLDVPGSRVSNDALRDLWEDIPQLLITPATGGIPVRKGESLEPIWFN